MTNVMPMPKYNKRIFWDVDFEQLDHNVKSKFIIERVFNRGDVEDIRECRRYYGDDKIKITLLNAKFIADHRLHLASAILNQPLSAFRCYILKQSNPTLYPY
jgi:nicotinamide mononucleotide adenylyltransferase